MSRIHEALKKAEHERTVSGPQPLPVEATPGFEGVDPEAPVSLSSAYAAAVAAPPMPPQALYTQCRQTNWNPDRKAMLFFNGDDHLTGMEERLHRQPGQLENGLADALARDRPGVHAYPAHHLRAIDHRHALSQLCRRNGAFLSRGSASNHHQIEMIVIHARKSALKKSRLETLSLGRD